MVVDVLHRMQKKHVSGIGKEAIFIDQDLGWWLLLDGSYEAIYAGATQPDFVVGDHVKISFERIEPNAKDTGA